MKRLKPVKQPRKMVCLRFRVDLSEKLREVSSASGVSKTRFLEDVLDKSFKAKRHRLAVRPSTGVVDPLQTKLMDLLE
jgi:molecular chaperone DnaK (HSP70)